MKHIIGRIIIYIFLILTFLILGIIGYINKPLDVPDPKILNINYYKYNTNTGNYEEIKLTENELYYNGELFDLNNCKNYTYNDETGIIKLDCRKAFRIVGFTEEALVININKENQYFYKEKEKSFNGEFQRKFKMAIDTYKKEGENLLTEKEISIEEFKNLLNGNDTSYIYIKGNNCKNECTLFNKEFLSFSSKDNIYYLNTTKLTENDIEELKELNKIFNTDLLNGNYPQIIIIENKEIEILRIEGKGFDYSMYHNYANNMEEENE